MTRSYLRLLAVAFLGVCLIPFVTLVCSQVKLAWILATGCPARTEGIPLLPCGILAASADSLPAFIDEAIEPGSILQTDGWARLPLIRLQTPLSQWLPGREGVLRPLQDRRQFREVPQ